MTDTITHDHDHDLDEDVTEDLTEAGADALTAAGARASMVPEGIDHHTAERIEQAMAVTERYGSWTERGFSPFLVRPVEMDAKAFSLASNKPAPVALRIVQRQMKQDATDPDYFVGRVVLNTSHVTNHLAPHIVAIYSPSDSGAIARGSVAIAFLYQPTEWTTEDGRTTTESASLAPGWPSRLVARPRKKSRTPSSRVAWSGP